MTRKSLSLILIIIALLLPTAATAQQVVTTETAIALAMTVPEIADGLSELTDYEAFAYNSNNAYGIWQIEFQDFEGTVIATAQVQPSTGRVYAWEANFPAEDAAYDLILPVFREFIAGHPDVRGLVRGITQENIYPWWDGGEQGWVAWIGDAGDAIMVVVQFDGGQPDSAENPVLTQLWFPNLPSYNEWRVAAASQAVAIAFQNAEIAASLRGKTWTTETTLGEDGSTNIWSIAFFADGAQIVTATVNIIENAILEYDIP